MTTSSELASRRNNPADPIADAARRHFAIPYLYPIQRFVISNMLEEKNQIVVLPTGSGKSLCYQLPARIGGGLTVVVVPLLSLLTDQLERCRQAGLHAEAIRGGQSREQRRRVLSELRCGAVELLFTTPESLRRVSRERLPGDGRIVHVVVDEAHCISEWGSSFRPIYLELGGIIRNLEPRCLTAFTATAGPRIVEKIQEVLFPEQRAAVLTADPDRPNIRYRVVPTLSKSRSLRLLVGCSPKPVLVFGRTRSAAQRAARNLRRSLPDLDARFYHAGLEREDRERVEAWFKGCRNGVLAATSAYGMGIDKADIRTVIHLDVPYSPEAYLQETGRAGRDGAPVEATLLYSAEDLGFAELLGRAPGNEAAGLRETAAADPLAAERYAQMLGYALDGSRCRREQLLGFLGREPASCTGCDVCDGQAVKQAEGQEQILDFLSRNRRRFTLRQTVELLQGAGSYEVVRSGLASYPAFGLLAVWQEEEIEEALESLQRSGTIRVLKRGFWGDRITTGQASAPG